MNIQPNNNVHNTEIYPIQIQQSNPYSLPVQNALPQITQLPSQHVGATQINTNVPVSYCKTGEFQIPGVENKAEIFKLANGQKVVILPKKGPTVVKSVFNVGSLNEPDELRGISHYIEHNLFNGSKGLAPGEYWQKVSDMGSSTNAGTGFYSTNYYIHSNLWNNNDLEEIIKLNAAQVQNPTFPIDQLEKEKGPVTSEISMYSDSTGKTAYNIMIKNLFNIQSTSEDMVAGTINNIKSMKREDVINYYNTWYSPDNTTTIITGDVNVQKTMELVSKYYNKQNPKTNMPKLHEELNPIQESKRVDIKKDNATATEISIGFAGPKNCNTRQKIATSALIYLLNGYNNARLNKALDKNHVNSIFYTEKLGNSPENPQMIVGELSVPENKAEDSIKTIYEEIAKLKTNPPTEKELNIVKQKLINNFLEQNEYSESINSFIEEGMLDNDMNYLTNYTNILQSLTVQDLIDATQFLDLNKASICVVHPTSVTDEQIMENYNKSKQIKTQNKSVSFGRNIQNVNKDISLHNKVKEYTIPNNMKVAINPSNTGRSIFSLDFSTDYLKDISLPETAILTELLNRGSIFNDNHAFHDKLDNENIYIGFTATPSGISVYSKFAPEKINEAMNLTNEVISNPRFTQEEFEAAKQKVYDTLINCPKSPYNKLTAELFPDIKSQETKEEALKTLNSLTLEKIQNTYQRLFTNAQGQAVLTAPVEQNPMLEQYFCNNLLSTIPQLQPYQTEKKIDIYKPITEAKTLVDVEQNAQAQITKTYKYKRSGNIQDEAKIQLLTEILGKGASSRLFLDLREKQKLAYHVSSSLDNLQNTSYINFYITTTTDDPTDPDNNYENVTKSLNGFDKHVQKLKTELVSEDELEQAKLLLKNDIITSLESNNDMTIDISGSMSSAYGIKQTELLLKQIDKITAQDIMDTANYMFANPAITSIVASKKTLDSLNLQ